MAETTLYILTLALVFGCLYAEDAENIHIFGNGVLDDSNEARFHNYCYEPYTNGNLKFYDCKNLRIEGILCKDSAIWCLNLFHCLDVQVDGIKIFGQWRYNTDGIDIVNCQHIMIRNSFIHSFDDTITIKGIDRYATTNNEHILVEHCVLWCDWGKTCEVGIETACQRYRDITFRDCDLLRAGNTALDIMDGDCAEISDITFENIRVEYERFYTVSQYQGTDDTVYTQQNTIEIPALIGFANPIWRSPDTVATWGIPGTLLTPLDLSEIRCGVIHDVVCRDIAVYYDTAIGLREDGRYPLPIRIWSCRNGVRFANILVENVSVNGVRLTEETAVLEVRDTDGFVFR